MASFRAAARLQTQRGRNVLGFAATPSHSRVFKAESRCLGSEHRGILQSGSPGRKSLKSTVIRRVSGVFPSQLPSDAWIIQLGENGITDLKPHTLRSVPKIESLNLERNAIKSIHPGALAGAEQLMLLNLFGNHISSLPPRGFQELLNLRFLMLGQNQIG
ncbi:leucine-rich repeat neuronal protein 3-like [Salarias fasciatus]|uniref:leucine-rich repeat neuronal protein 3-like n=1 Tax=Salarias fasciatus TaxID=181472 RepID=UPI001176CFEC|nr:leucine-rich repeat neuronal protein 3-like [Salarias fasciatus]